MGLIGFQCIVGQWRFDLQTFRLAATIPIRINSISRGSAVLCCSISAELHYLVPQILRYYCILNNRAEILFFNIHRVKADDAVSHNAFSKITQFWFPFSCVFPFVTGKPFGTTGWKVFNIWKLPVSVKSSWHLQFFFFFETEDPLSSCSPNSCPWQKRYHRSLRTLEKKLEMFYFWKNS